MGKIKRHPFRFLELNHLTDIIPLLEAGLTSSEIALVYRRKPVTVFRWIRRLKEEGYDVEFTHGNKGGRPRLKL